MNHMMFKEYKEYTNIFFPDTTYLFHYLKQLHDIINVDDQMFVLHE